MRDVILMTDQVFGDAEFETSQAQQAGFEFILAPAKTAEAIRHASDPARVRCMYNTYFGPVDGPLMDGFKHLKGIVRCGIGVDTIDLEAAQIRGIKVANVPDYCMDEVASHALTLFLNLARKVSICEKQVRQGSWMIGKLKPIQSVGSYTCGVIGLGRIGRQLAAMLAPLVKTVMYFDPVVADPVFPRVDLETIYARCDAVFLHVPLTAQTQGLFCRGVFEKLAQRPLLINVSRGGLIVTDDLVQALEAGRIRGVGLDILDGIGEGVTTHPIFQFDQAILTPHSAWYSEQAMVKLREKAMAEALRMAKGEDPIHRVV